MAQKINVNRNVQDPFYRYKMPRIVAKVEGKGNGIKTVIANMTDIAKALSRPPTYPTKYFGCELGAQTNFDLKNDRYIVNGEHDGNKLQDLLDGFIKKFVLCSSCDNPETILNVKKQAIYAKCKACGHQYQIDPKQKLSTFIIKNPPTQENGESEKDTNKNENSEISPTEEVIEEILPAENTNLSVINNSNEAADDDDWAPEPDDLGGEKLSGEMSKMVIDKDLEKSTEERLDMLHQYFMKSMKERTILDGKKMLNEAERLELKCKAPLLLANVLFTKNVISELKQYRNLLLRFCIDDTKAQRHLLGGVEQLVYKNKELLPKTAHIIKALYDNDICDEEVLLEWNNKTSGRFVKKDFVKEMNKVAKPVIDWLKEAEECSESEEESNIAVAFDDRSRGVGTVIVDEPKIITTSNSKGHQNEYGNNKEVNDEVDIDNI